VASNDPQDYPPNWIPLRDFPDIRAMLLLPVPEDAWGRVLPDESRGGFPAFIQEAFWITAPVMHLLRVDGFTFDQREQVHATDERRILSHERISLEQIEDWTFDLNGKMEGTVVLTGSGRRLDLPVPLIHSHLPRGAEGYGRR
jgi:hypothetical protein